MEIIVGSEEKKNMDIICSERVSIENTDMDMKYFFVKDNSESGYSYGFIAELYKNSALIGKEKILGVTHDLGKAVKLYGLFINHKPTPIDLKYVIEDILPQL